MPHQLVAKLAIVIQSLDCRLHALQPGVALGRTDLDVAIIGCYVNGPGESRAADVGVTGSAPHSLVFVGGEPHHKTDSTSLVDDIERTIRAALADRAAAPDAGDDALIAKG